MTCSLEQFNQSVKDYLESNPGMTEKQAKQDVAQLYAVKQFTGISEKLTQEQSNRLRTLWSKIAVDNLTLSDLEDVAFTGSFSALLNKRLTTEEQTELTVLLTGVGINFESLTTNEHRNLQEISSLRDRFRELGDTETVQELEDLYNEEQRALKIRDENRQASEGNIFLLEEQISAIDALLAITQKVETDGADAKVKALRTKLDEMVKTVEAEIEAVKIFNAQLEALDKAREQAQANKDFDEVRNLDNKIKALKDANKEIQKKQKTFKEKAKKINDLKEELAKATSDSDLNRFTAKLTQERDRVTSRLIALNVSSLGSALNTSIKNAKQTAIQRERLKSIAEAGREARLNILDPYKNEIPKILVESLFTKRNVEQFFQNQGIAELPENMTRSDVEEIAKRWSNGVRRTFNGSFFSSDSALLGMSKIDAINALVNQQLVANPTQFGLAEHTITPSQPPGTQPHNPGTVPDSGKVESHAELIALVEAAWRRLRTTYGFNGFTGTISEDVLKSILGSKFLDIGANFWEEAREVTRLPRNISNLSQTDRAAIPIAMMRALGHPDPMSMPEYSDPGFDTNFKKLITIDIEAAGNVKSEGDDRIKEVYVIQVNEKEILPDGSVVQVSKILVNTDDGELKNILDPAIRNVSKKRKAITKAQLTNFFRTIEAKQDNGFKVATYNGNNYDFAYLTKLVDDQDLLGRVALRSFDLLALITSQIPAGSWKAKSFTGGRKLKQILDNNAGSGKPLSRPVEPDFKTSQFIYSSGSVVDRTDGKPIELDPINGITPMWDQANSEIDTNPNAWDRFDAYSINDINLTMSLFEQLGSQESTKLYLNPKVTVEVPTPRSNLKLNNNGESNEGRMEDSLQAIGTRFDKISSVIEQTFYKAGYGYRADDIDTILKELYMAALMASDRPEDLVKRQALKDILVKKTQKEATLEVLTVEQSRSFKEAKQEQNKRYFNEYGFVLKLNYQNNSKNPSVVEIESPESGDLPKGNYRKPGGKDPLFRFSTASEEIYVTNVINAFMGFINNPQNKFRFQNALKRRVKPREQQENESDSDYWKDVISTYIKQYLPMDTFNGIQDFGNGNLDWKPANEVGIAIAQVMMNQVQGVKAVDISIHNGETLESVELRKIEESMKSGSERPKIFGMPNRDAVHMAQPFTLVDELIAYDGFRLRQRLNWARDIEITPELIEYLTTEQKQQKFDPITTYNREMTLDISPDATVRSWLSSVPSLQEKKENTYRFLYEIPRLLVSFNHDCEYMGMRMPRRFLNSELPIFFAEDFAHPGAPTAAATLSGALEQLAWFTNFGITGPESTKILEDIVERGLKYVVDRGVDAFDDSNKADYRYSGKHLILATIMAYRGDDQIFTDLLKACGVKNKDGELITDYSKGLFLKGSELPDPRLICFDLLTGTFDEKGNSITPGFLDQLQDPKSPASQEFKGYDPTIAQLSKKTLIKLKRASQKEGGKGDVKNFLKGVITPAFFQSGRKGFEQGLKNKNKELQSEDRLTDEEIEFLAELLNNGRMVSEGRIVDKAIAFSRTDIQKLKEIIVTRLQQRVTPDNTSILRRKSLLHKKPADERIKELHSLYQISIDRISERALPPGLTKEKYKEQLLSRDKEAIQRAAEIWSEIELDKLDGYEYNEAIMRINIALAGGDEKTADRNLLLYGLSRRATTKHVMVDEVADLHSQILGYPRNNEDLVAYLNRDIYFRYGIEAASGRNHMARWFGIGPEGPKFAQPRVLDDSKERNILGMWDIDEVGLEKEFNDLFYKQVLFDLAPFIRPPQELGYDPQNESLQQYFQAVENRSPMELVASEESKFLEKSMGDDEKVTLSGGHTMTIKQIKELRNRYIGFASSRLYMRTTLDSSAVQDKVTEAHLNTNIPGFGALRPYYSNIHMTQLGIYALTEVQARNSIAVNPRLQLLKRATQRADKAAGDPNSIIDPEFRGFSHYLSPQDLLHIPMSGEDFIGGIALMEDINPETLRIATQLETELTEFALAFGLEDLLAKRDFGRLVTIRRIYDRAFVPAARELTKIKADDLNRGDHIPKLTQARIRFADGVSKTITITERSLSGKHTTSVIDLLAGKEEGVLTVDDYRKLQEQYGDTIYYMQLLNYLAKTSKVSRLMGLQFGITSENGVVVLGRPSRANMPSTAHSPNFIHGREIITIYNKILASDTAKRVLKEVLDEIDEDFDGIIYDSSGFPILESLDVAIGNLKGDPDKQVRLVKIYKQAWNRIQDRVGELSRELNTKFTLVPDASHRVTLRDQITGDVLKEQTIVENTGRSEVEYIPLTSQGAFEGQEFVFTQGTNPATLWQFTPALLDQLLNLTNNYSFLRELELGVQTRKETRVMRSDIDLMKEETEARRFESWRENSDALSEALILLRKFNPVDPNNSENALRTIKDFRDPLSNKEFREVVDFGSYYSSKNSYFTVIVGKQKDGKDYFLRVKTIDAPYVIKLLSYSRKAEKLGLMNQAKELQNFIIKSFNPNQRDINIGLSVKILATALQSNAESNLAKETILDFFNVKNDKQRENLLKELNKILPNVQSIDSGLAFQDNRLLYKAMAIIEKNPFVDFGDIDPYIDSMVEGEVSPEGENFLRGQAVLALKNAATQIETIAKVEDLDPSIASNRKNDPTIFATSTAEEFGSRFPMGLHQSSAENIWNALDAAVRQGAMSEYTRDMKLMLIGTMAAANPEILSDFALHLDNTGDLMYAEKLNGKYRIGMNITALKKTRDQEILFKFAEELLHIARLKFIRTDSSEWSAITSIYRNKNSRGMIREILMSMNGGRGYDNIENEVSYVMDNEFGPDEFFAHLGAFFLLRQVLGSEQAIAALRTKYETVNASLNLWQRAFHSIKSTVKRILVNFNNLKANPMYSELLGKAENVILPMISSGYAPRVDVGNPNAKLNTYQRWALTRNNATFDPSRIARLNQLRIDLAAATTDDEKNNIQHAINSIDVMTSFGIRESEIQPALDELTFAGTGRSISTDLLHDNERIRKAFLARVVQNTIGIMGERATHPYTMTGLVRSFTFGSNRLDNAFSGASNIFLQYWNASNLTYNSPIAPLAAMAHLLDMTGATTNGSFASVGNLLQTVPNRIGGFEQQKAALEPAFQAINNIWASYVEHFPDPTRQYQFVQRVITRVNTALAGGGVGSIGGSTSTNQQEATIERDMVSALVAGIHMTKTLMVEAGFAESMDSLDSFPVRFKDLSELNDDDQNTVFNQVQEFTSNRYLNMMNTQGLDTPISSVLLLGMGMLPIRVNQDPNSQRVTISSSDATILNHVVNQRITTGPGGAFVPLTGYDEGRTAMVYALFDQAARVYTNTNPGATINDFYNDAIAIINRNPAELWREITSRGREFAYQLRNHNLSLNHRDVLPATNASIKQAIFDNYRKRFENNGAIVVPGSDFQDENTKRLIHFHPKSTSRNFMIPITNEITLKQLFTNQIFGEIGANSVLVPTNSYIPTSTEWYNSGQQAIDRIMESHVDTITKSMLRGTGFDALTRIMVQRISGVPGAYVSIDELLNLMEQDAEANSGAMPIKLLDTQGQEILNESAKNTMIGGIRRLKLAVNEIRGVTSNTADSHGRVQDRINSVLKQLVVLRWGGNINFATTLVEGMQTVFNTATTRNPVNAFIDLAFQLYSVVEQDVPDFIHDSILNYLPNRRFKTFPLRTRSRKGLAKNSTFFLDIATSPYLPDNLTRGDYSSAMVNRLGRWGRFMETLRRANSRSMRTLRVANEALANRDMIRLLRSGKLERLRATMRTTGIDRIRTVADIKQLFSDAGVFMDQESAVYLFRSGILNGNALEALQYTIDRSGTYLGTIEYNNLIRVYRLSSSNRLRGVRFNHLDVQQATAAIERFSKDKTQMAMVTRQPLDAPYQDSLGTAILTFYKSYPTLFMAQQILRRGSIASPLRTFAWFMLNTSLDIIYNIVLGLARGSYDLEKIYKMAAKAQNDEKQRKQLYKELAKLASRSPIFSTSPAGSMPSQAVLAGVGGYMANDTMSAVGEAAFLSSFADALKVTKTFASPKHTWKDGVFELYRKFGGALPAGMGGPLVRAATSWAYSNALGGSSNGTDNELQYQLEMERIEDPGEVMMENFIRETLPTEPSQRQAPKRNIQEQNNKLKQQFMDTYGKRLEQYQPKKPQEIQQPPQPTEVTSNVNIGKEATTPEKAPEGLV